MMKVQDGKIYDGNRLILTRRGKPLSIHQAVQMQYPKFATEWPADAEDIPAVLALVQERQIKIARAARGDRDPATTREVMMVLEVLILKMAGFRLGLSRHVDGFKLYLPGLFVAVNRHEHLRRGD